MFPNLFSSYTAAYSTEDSEELELSTEIDPEEFEKLKKQSIASVFGLFVEDDLSDESIDDKYIE